MANVQAPTHFLVRHGAWYKFRLDDEAAKTLEEAGAHKTADGFFLGIFQAASPERHDVGVLGADGKFTPDPAVPERLMVVDGNGNNLPVPHYDKELGHAEFKNASFHPSAVHDLHPMDDVAHLPPGRKIPAGWKPHEQIMRERHQNAPQQSQTSKAKMQEILNLGEERQEESEE